MMSDLPYSRLLIARNVKISRQRNRLQRAEMCFVYHTAKSLPMCLCLFLLYFISYFSWFIAYTKEKLAT
jgi:hypothetical protein